MTAPAPAYVNIHGQPVGTSARDAVRVIYPDSQAKKADLLSGELWLVRKNSKRFSLIVGSGCDEEAAWRDAWSRVLSEAVEAEVRP